MRKVLILLTSSYPYGQGEPFLANEVPYLAEAFDRVIVVSNDTTSEQVYPLPQSAMIVRRSYALGPWDTAAATLGLVNPRVGRDILWMRSRLGRTPDARDLSMALVSWRKALGFARLLRDLAREAGGQVHAYSYWANDMALAAALARRRGWVARAYCRAHGWDVYADRIGYLPFREFLAAHLDHYLFVSDHGLRYTQDLLGTRYPSMKVARLGTPPSHPTPVARHRPFTVISCSGMIPLKRVSLIAEALHHVTTPMRWIHIGAGPARHEVEALVATLPAGVTAELRGQVANSEVMEVYGRERPSVFLNVSRTEGLPVSMMEAMSAGVPVMGTGVGGVGEIIADGSNGVLLPDDPTPLQLATALDRFAAMPASDHAAFARRAWDTWQDSFRADHAYRAFVRLVHD